MTDLRNRIIGAYQLEVRLASTETGELYRAWQLADQKLVAIKIIRAELTKEPVFRATLRHQAIALRALQHPHIVDLITVGVQDDLCYQVTEWLPDGTLQDFLQHWDSAHPQRSLTQALDMVRQAAEALDYAYQQGFVHGSIKPANLWLRHLHNAHADAAYTVKIADFGLAWLAIHNEAISMDVWPDSLVYAMAPERCQGLDVDSGADIYALGVILYEIATGNPPFEIHSLDTAVYRHVYTQPTPPRQIVPDLPAELETIILRCLAKAPSDRFARAADLAAALQALLAEMGFQVSQADVATPSGPLNQHGTATLSLPLSTNGHTVVSPRTDSAVVVELEPLSRGDTAWPEQVSSPQPLLDQPDTPPISTSAPTLAAEPVPAPTTAIAGNTAPARAVPMITAAQYQPEDLLEQHIGEYRLQAYLGKSETGHVYRAMSVETEELVAIKIIHTALVQDPTFWQGFQDQAKHMRLLQHPGITDVAAVGVQDGLCYQAIEWLPDGTLRNLLQRRANPDGLWSLALAVELVRQVAEALDFAHTRGFVHGSIKPNNLLLLQQNGQAGPSYTVKIADFGLAWLALHSESNPLDVWPDTLVYAMAPERCQGLEIDNRADIYALGVILYEIATGSPPFETKTLDSAVYRHVYTQPTPPRKLVPDLAPDFEAIILRCLAKAPADRFARAADLADALQALLDTSALAPRRRVVAKPTISATVRQQPVGQVIPQVNALDQYGRPLSALPLTGDGLTVGRAADNDLVLDAPAIEARHLLVDWDGQTALVTNLTGSNNVVIGDAALLAHATHSWEWESPIRLGPFWLRLEATKVDSPSANTNSTAPARVVLDEASNDGIVNTEDATPIAPAANAKPAPPLETLTDRIGIVLDQPTLTLTPGRPATFRMTLANLGSLVDHLTVTVEQIPDGWVTGPPPVVQLNPGAQSLVTLNITVPQIPESRAGDYPVIVRVRSRERSSDSNIAPAQWTVLPFTHTTFDLKPKRLRRRLRANYRMAVRNLGNAPARYQLSATDDEEALNYRFSEDQLTLEPGAAAKLNLVARPNRIIWFGQNIVHRFTVQIKPTSDEEPQTALAQFEQSALFTRLVLILLALLVLAGLVWLWLWYRPKIATLSVDPSMPVVGQPFVVQWQVTNAPTVELRVNGTQVALPVRASRQVFSGFASPPDIRLTARNQVYGQDNENLLVTMVSPTPTLTPLPTLRPTATATPTDLPPTPTLTPVLSPTPIPPTPTIAPTMTPTSQTLCIAGDFAYIYGEGPPLTAFLVYLDGRAVGGGTTDARGHFRVALGLVNESPGDHAVVVRDRNTNKVLRSLTCIVPR